MPLTLQALINNKLLDELANCFTSEWDANLLLDAIGFPTGIRPNFRHADNPLAFWASVCKQIENGVIQDGFETLLMVAGNRLPGNHKFAPFAIASRTPSFSGTSTYINAVSDTYDVFLSFSSKDRAMVTEIATQLKRQGVEPWLDEWALPLGKPLVKEIQEILTQVKAVVVFYGQNGFGPWQEAEVDIAIERQLRGECLLIPVMLPGVSSSNLPPFLRRLHGIRIMDTISIENGNALEKLVREIRQNSAKR